MLLGSVVSLVLTLLIIRSVESSSNWVFVAFFLICTTQVLRLRWAVGAALLSVPVAVCAWRNLLVLVSTEPLSLRVSSTGPLAPETIFHLAAAWAVGTLMGYLADSSRREAFASHRLALSAAATELVEVRARVAAEHKLAAAQAVAEARSSMAEREKASIEAKSEFISMLCHEIRTPLNGCLASAEMLLQTELSVRYMKDTRTGCVLLCLLRGCNGIRFGSFFFCHARS